MAIGDLYWLVEQTLYLNNKSVMKAYNTSGDQIDQHQVFFYLINIQVKN